MFIFKNKINNRNKNKNISVEVLLSDDFSGIMYGLPEESIGCKLSGKVILENRNSFSVKYLALIFIGKTTVACGPPMSTTRPEYSETQLTYRKECLFHSSETSSRKISAGTHEYYFDFDLPGHLPSSFKGPRGKIEYYCNVILARPRFRNDLSVKKSVFIKRCLMDEERAQALNTTFAEGILNEKVRYQISTPIMTFREGGLVNVELALKPINSGTVIEAVEYGLKEQIHYHTTGVQLMSVVANVNEDRYPLGPKKQITFDSNFHDSNPILINFRLCPWVNCDVDSRLIHVFHKLLFTVCISETISIENQSELSCTVNDSENNNSDGENLDSRRMRRISFPITLRNTGPRRENDGRPNRSVSLLPPPRNSRFSIPNISNIVNSRRTTLITKVEKKSLDFEIPIIITSKCCRPNQQSPPYVFIDRPPSYAIALMIPPPPRYTEDAEDGEDGDENILSRESIEYAYEDS